MKQKYDNSKDPTQQSLEAALLDQQVAGMMGAKPYAYVAVIGEASKWNLGIAAEDEAGYNPVPYFEFDNHDEAADFADGMNKHIGLDGYRSAQIICSSMRLGSAAA